LKLYAAFDEYGNIWPTTIRKDFSEAQEALFQERPTDAIESFSAHGIGIGSFNSGNSISGFNVKVFGKVEHVWGCTSGPENASDKSMKFEMAARQEVFNLQEQLRNMKK